MMTKEQNMDYQQDSWKTLSFRQNVRSKIEETIRQSGNPTTKSVIEMENHVFKKAKSKEEYLAFIARVIIHIRENPKRNTTGAVRPPNMAPSAGVGIGNQVYDPMSALRNMAGGKGSLMTVGSQSLGSGGTISQLPTPQPQPQIPIQPHGQGIPPAACQNIVTSINPQLPTPQPQPHILIQLHGQGIPPATGPNTVTSINPPGMSPMVMQQQSRCVMASPQMQQQAVMRAHDAFRRMLTQQQVQGHPPNVTSTQIARSNSCSELRTTSDAFSFSDILKQAQDIFPDHLVLEALKKIGSRAFTLQEICEEILELRTQGEESRNNPATSDVEKAESKVNDGLSSNDVLTCSVCLDRERSTVFHPCRHFVSCWNCSNLLSNCPVCRRPVAHKIRIYVS